MNGLEAIRAMEKGEIVQSFHYGSVPCLYKIEDGKVMEKYGVGSNNDWRDCPRFILEGGYKFYNPNQNTGWFNEYNQKNNDNYYVFGFNNQIVHTSSLVRKTEADEDSFSQLAKAQEIRLAKAREIRFKQGTFRKLQQFSDENGGNEIDSTNDKSCKYYIYYNYEEEELAVSGAWSVRDFGQVYFKTEELAELAIELFKKDLIKYFTHKWMECE